jgi:hypothetical protein
MVRTALAFSSPLYSVLASSFDVMALGIHGRVDSWRQ